MRTSRFLRSLWRQRRLCFRSPVDWRNVRACWIVSGKLRPWLEMSDEELDRFLAALDDARD